MAEREAKLIATSDFHLPSFDDLPKNLRAGDWETIEQRAVYFDTRDLRLVRNGASLRYRSDDGWTVKLPRDQRGSVLERTEHFFVGDFGPPPQAALDLVRARTRTQPLREVAQVATRRRRTNIVDAHGTKLAEIADDRVATTTSQSTKHFREIEVELTEDAPADVLDHVVERLRRAGAESNDAIPKISRALGASARADPDVVLPDRADMKRSTRALVRAAIARSVERLLKNDPAVRLGDDVEAVHQARVATRRLRSDLRTFRPLLVRSWSEPLRDELRWLGELLGHVRDLDALDELFARQLTALPPEDAAAGDDILQCLSDARAREHQELLAAMNSGRYTQLLERLVDAAHSPHLRKGAARRPGRRVLAQLIGKPWARVRKAARNVDEGATDAQLHELRKRTKQVRYAIEVAAPVSGKHATRLAKRFAHLQDVLGHHQDDVVGRAWLVDAQRDFAETYDSFVAGEIAGYLTIDQVQRRHDWPRAWREASKGMNRLL